MAEPLEVPRATLDAAQAVLHDQPYHRIPYSNLQLYGEGFRPDLDTDCLVEIDAMSSYWPGGIPETDKFYATIQWPDEHGTNPYSKIADVRTGILGLKLPKSALRRWTDFSSRHLPAQAPTEPESDEQAVETICALYEAPLALVGISRVIRHRSIPAGEKIANLYFPSIARFPDRVLDKLQVSLQAVIDEETL